MSQNPSLNLPASLKIFVQCLKVPDPRSQRGQSHRFLSILAIVLLGLLANLSTLARQISTTGRTLGKETTPETQEIPKIEAFLTPSPSPVSCKNSPSKDLQQAFAEFLNTILQDTTLVAAVDGKTAKQMRDEDGEPIHLLTFLA